MNQTSDYNAQLIFNLGAYANSTIYLDNISLTKVLRGDFDTSGRVDIEDLAVLAAEWLNTGGSFQADIDRNQTVELNDFSIFAENWLTGCSTQPTLNTLE